MELLYMYIRMSKKRRNKKLRWYESNYDDPWSMFHVIVDIFRSLRTKYPLLLFSLDLGQANRNKTLYVICNYINVREINHDWIYKAQSTTETFIFLSYFSSKRRGSLLLNFQDIIIHIIIQIYSVTQFDFYFSLKKCY